jgi:hypothetical protein
MTERKIPMFRMRCGSAAEWISKVFAWRDERFHNGVGTVTDVVLELDGAIVMVKHPTDAVPGPAPHARPARLHDSGSRRRTS